MGLKVENFAFKNRDMLLIINNKEICLDYQLKGRCNWGDSYRNSSSHYFLEKPDFQKLINWSKEIISKYNETPTKPEVTAPIKQETTKTVIKNETVSEKKVEQASKRES